MSVSLPAAIATFFELSNGMDNTRLADCFAQDATVQDESQTYRGRDAIVAWKSESQKKFEYSVEPLSVSHDGDQVTVVANVVGNFPGSPVQLEYKFLLSNMLIKSLEIR